MKLKDFDGRIWNPRFKQFGVLEGEITTEGEINGIKRKNKKRISDES